MMYKSVNEDCGKTKLQVRKKSLAHSFLLVALVSFMWLSGPKTQAQSLTDSYNGGRGENFNSDWKFNLGDIDGAQNVAFSDASWRSLNVPHDWSIELAYNRNSPSRSGGGYLDGGIGWYRKSFTLTKSESGKRICIEFDGIYMDSEVFVNGKLVGNRPNGYNSFEFDVTPFVHFDGKPNILAVKVKNQQPSSRWYSGSGIYRNVWLTKLDPVHIAYCGLFVTTPSIEPGSATANVKTEVRNESKTAQKINVTTVITDAKGLVKSKQTSETITIPANAEYRFSQNLKISKPQLWSPTSPYLYRVKTVVTKSSGTLAKTDTYHTTLGVRTLKFDPNTGFSINGDNIKLKGTCMHQDLGCLGRAINYRAMERQIEILKEMGCNAIRTAHNAPSPELIEICDKLGMMVMEEAFDCWETSKEKYDYGRFFTQWAQTDIRGQVRRDRNNPSIIMWSIGNEINRPSVATGRNLRDWVRMEDSSRVVTWASNGMGNDICQQVTNELDVAGYNYWRKNNYENDHIKYPNRVIFGSETCAARSSRETYVFDAARHFGNLDPDVGSSYDNSFGAGGITVETDWKKHASLSYVAGSFIWTGFDFLGENDWPTINHNGGAIDRCGFKKDIFYFLQSQWTDEPMVHILPHWNWKEGDSYLTAKNGKNIDTAFVAGTFNVPVWVYTNCDSVELFLNDKSLGVHKFEKDGAAHLEWNIPFTAGTLRAVGKRKGATAASDIVKTAEAPARVILSTDHKIMKADGENLVFITADIVDANGVINPRAENTVKFSVTGPGTIVGVDNGNSMDHSAYKSDTRNAFGGKCLAVIRSNGSTGQIVVTATSSGLSSNTITIPSVAVASAGKTKGIGK